MRRAGAIPSLRKLMHQAEAVQRIIGTQMRRAEEALKVAPVVPEAAPADPHFKPGQFTATAGNRRYKLYLPAGMPRNPMLVVMLHGCTQDADDFAAGTGMNRLAQAQGFAVLYPEQAKRANAQRCWNWFQPGDQARDGGELAVIAEMTKMVMARHGVDPTRVYVAGLSAGGALAANLGAAYPDIFAAIGVHSGLACGAASDLAQALAAMAKGRQGSVHHVIPSIVFHGDADRTVNVRNAEAVIAQTAVPGVVSTAQGQVAGGHTYVTTRYAGSELWVVHGMGHAWSGGDTAGRFVDPAGPSASVEMVRFFNQHRLG